MSRLNILPNLRSFHPLFLQIILSARFSRAFWVSSYVYIRMLDAMVSVFVYPKMCLIKSRLPKMMMLGIRAFGKCLCHEGGALLKGIRTIMKKAPESSNVNTQLEGASYKSGRGPSPVHTGALILAFPVSRTVRNTFLLL